MAITKWSIWASRSPTLSNPAGHPHDGPSGCENTWRHRHVKANAPRPTISGASARRPSCPQSRQNTARRPSGGPRSVDRAHKYKQRFLEGRSLIRGNTGATKPQIWTWKWTTARLSPPSRSYSRLTTSSWRRRAISEPDRAWPATWSGRRVAPSNATGGAILMRRDRPFVASRAYPPVHSGSRKGPARCLVLG